MSVSYFNAPVQIPNAKSLTLADADNSATLQLKPNDTTTSYTIEFPASLGNNNQVLSITSNVGSKAELVWSDVSVSSIAADNITTGGSNVNITTSTGNVTVGAPSDSNIALQIDDTNVIFLNSSSVQFSQNAVPAISDGAALGTSSLMWSDLFLASAGVINFDNGDMTLTHSANNLTVAGGTLTSSGRVLVDDSTDATTTTDGSLQTDGGLSVALSIFNGTSATLASASGTVTMGSTTAATVSASGIVNVNNTTEATTTTDGSLQTDGGLSVVKSAVIGGNVAIENKLTFGMDRFTSLGATTGARSNLFATSNVSSIKSIEINASASFASIPSGANGQMLHLFYTNNASGNTQIDFGANNLYAGSGTAQYLEFTQTGQSATLVYINNDNGVGGWRIINTGATVS